MEQKIEEGVLGDKYVGEAVAVVIREGHPHTFADQLAHLNIVEAHVVGVGARERSAVVTDGLDAMRLCELLDLLTSRFVDGVEDQNLGALGDIGLRKGYFLGDVALSVVDLELRR